MVPPVAGWLMQHGVALEPTAERDPENRPLGIEPVVIRKAVPRLRQVGMSFAPVIHVVEEIVADDAAADVRDETYLDG